MQTFGTGEILATKRKQNERKSGKIRELVGKTERLVAPGVEWECPWEDVRVDESNGICHFGSY